MFIDEGNQTGEVLDIDDDDAWDLGDEGIEDTDELEEQEESEEIETPEESKDVETSEGESDGEEQENEATEDDDDKDDDEPTSEFDINELELNVLGEKKLLKDIPKDELQPTMQKGYDYDRVKGQRDTLQEEANDWKEISKMFNMTPSEVQEALKEQNFKTIAETDGRSVEDVRKEYNSGKQSTREKMYSKFLDKYPDIKTDDLPEEVKDSVRMGEDLTKAYDKFMDNKASVEKDNKIAKLEKELDDAKAKLKVKDQNAKSKKKGVVKKGKADSIDRDDFLDGFLD